MKSPKRRVISGALVVLLLFAGLSAPAWLPGTGARALAASTPAPDLTIESVSLSPETASIGDTLTFTITIKNRGELQAGASMLACLIDEHQLATSPVAPVDAGAVTVNTFTWKAQAGPHVFRALIDSDGSVDESVEDNHDKTCAFSILAPDLAIDAISWTPVNPAVGDKVTFIITIANQGDKMARHSYVDFSIDGTPRGYLSTPGIEPGASVNETYTWTATSGVHNVRAVADVLHQVNESDEANNTSEASCATLAPDLIINSITISPTDFPENTEVIFTVIIKNQGGSRSGPSGVIFYIDDSLQDWVFLESLDAGATTTTNSTWVAGNGALTFRATVDVEDQVKESDETNNSRTFSLAPLYPDLVIQDITWSPTSPLLNNPVTFTITVKNQGKATAGPAEVKLNIDGTYVFNGMISELSVNATTTAIFTWMTQIFSHTVKATIDEANLVKESNKSNNNLTKTITFTRPVPSADLTIEKITCSPVKLAVGGTMTITLVVKNQGTGIASPSTTAIYIDSNLVDSVYTNELDAGKTLTLEITIPLQGLPFKDTYRVSAVVDLNNTVFETNESNNQKDTSFSIATPDLVVQAINWSPEAPAAGDRTIFDITVKNGGDCKSGSTYLSYYVDKAFMGKHRIEDIEPGTTVTRSFTWAVSKDSFVFTAVIDEENQVPENDKTNNTRTVFLPAPDLIIDSITWSPDNPTEIAPVTFTVSIRNRGYSRASGTLLSCYINGAMPTSLETGEISPGGTTTVVFTYSFLPGDHTIRLIADGNDVIAESNESNNEKTVRLSVQSRPTSTLPPAPESANKTALKPPVPGPTVTVKTSENLSSQNKTLVQKPAKDITANITAPPPKWQGILQNRWLITGTAALGLAAIGLLLIFRKKSRRK